MGSLQYFAVLLLISQVYSINPGVKFICSGLVPDVLPSVPKKLAQVTYDDKIEVKLGNKISVNSTKCQPCVTWEAKPDRNYTLAMVDPDVPSRFNRVLGEVEHWLVVDIPGCDLNKGFSIAPYFEPTPAEGSGLHRYAILVFLQPECKVHFKEGIVRERPDRFKFSIKKFAEKYKLQIWAGNYFRAQVCR